MKSVRRKSIRKKSKILRRSPPRNIKRISNKINNLLKSINKISLKIKYF